MTSIEDRAVSLAVSIEAMRHRHLRAVRQIDAKVYPRPWSLALYQQELARPATRVYRIARTGGSVVGYGGLMIVGTDGHVTSVAVDPEWQGRDIATRLVLAVARGAVEAGCEALTLEVRVSNDRAQELYRRFGFAPVGVRKGYYTENNEDAIVMWANDVSEPPYLERLRDIERGVVGTTDWGTS